MILNCWTKTHSEIISSSKQLGPSPSNWVQFSKILLPLRLATAIRTKLCNISSRSVSATPLQHRAMWFCGEETGVRRKKIHSTVLAGGDRVTSTTSHRISCSYLIPVLLAVACAMEVILRTPDGKRNRWSVARQKHVLTAYFFVRYSPKIVQ